MAAAATGILSLHQSWGLCHLGPRSMQPLTVLPGTKPPRVPAALHATLTCCRGPHCAALLRAASQHATPCRMAQGQAARVPAPQHAAPPGSPLRAVLHRAKRPGSPPHNVPPLTCRHGPQRAAISAVLSTAEPSALCPTTCHPTRAPCPVPCHPIQSHPAPRKQDCCLPCRTCSGSLQPLCHKLGAGARAAGLWGLIPPPGGRGTCCCSSTTQRHPREQDAGLFKQCQGHSRGRIKRILCMQAPKAPLPHPAWEPQQAGLVRAPHQPPAPNPSLPPMASQQLWS